MGNGEVGTKACPRCGATVASATEICARCGHAWSDMPVGSIIHREQVRLGVRLAVATALLVLVAIVVYVSILA